MDKKKIGIITYHAVCNFGAQLQTISTVGFLKRKGYEPIVIHWMHTDLDKHYQKQIPPEQYKCHIDFAEQNMPLTKLCTTENELVQIIDECNLDAIILGSDALFKYLPKSERTYFSKRRLRFVNVFMTNKGLEGNPFWGSFIPKLNKNIPVLVFSVSSQNTMYKKTNKEEFDELKKALERFKYITVRDEWTKQMVQYFLNNPNIPITPDPVFSFNQNTYLPVISKDDLLKKYNLPDNYILLSLGYNRKYVKKIEKEFELKKGYATIAFPTPMGLKNDYGLNYQITTPLSPLDWYYLIKHSSGYIGGLMHPVLVALHNNVPFFSFDGYGVAKCIIPFFTKYIKESSKIYDILLKVGLPDYVVPYKKKFKKIKPQMVVNKLLNFDENKVKIFSEAYQNYYEESMIELLKHIK